MIAASRASPGQLDDPDRVLATAKHFAGDGLTDWDTGEGDYTLDQGINRVEPPRLQARSPSRPIPPAIDRHDVGSVMPSFSSVDWTDDGLGNPLKMHAHEQLLTDTLKGDMGFDGHRHLRLAGDPPDPRRPTDAGRGVGQRRGRHVHGARLRHRSGVGRVHHHPDHRGRRRRVPLARIDDAVARILTAKFELGLFEHPMTDRITWPTRSAARRTAPWRATRSPQSQVLLRNEGRTLPLSSRDSRVYVAGSNADNIGNQAGGWTLTWQGGSTNVIPGDTVLDGIESQSRAR